MLLVAACFKGYFSFSSESSSFFIHLFIYLRDAFLVRVTLGYTIQNYVILARLLNNVTYNK